MNLVIEAPQASRDIHRASFDESLKNKYGILKVGWFPTERIEDRWPGGHHSHRFQKSWYSNNNTVDLRGYNNRPSTCCGVRLPCQKQKTPTVRV